MAAWGGGTGWREGKAWRTAGGGATNVSVAQSIASLQFLAQSRKGSGKKADHMSAGRPPKRSGSRARPRYGLLPVTSSVDEAQYGFWCPAFKASATPSLVELGTRARRCVESQACTASADKVQLSCAERLWEYFVGKLCVPRATDPVSYMKPSTVFLHSKAPFVAAIQSTSECKWPRFFVSKRTIAAQERP